MFASVGVFVDDQLAHPLSWLVEMAPDMSVEPSLPGYTL